MEHAWWRLVRYLLPFDVAIHSRVFVLGPWLLLMCFGLIVSHSLDVKVIGKGHTGTNVSTLLVVKKFFSTRRQQKVLQPLCCTFFNHAGNLCHTIKKEKRQLPYNKYFNKNDKL